MADITITNLPSGSPTTFEQVTTTNQTPEPKPTNTVAPPPPPTLTTETTELLIEPTKTQDITKITAPGESQAANSIKTEKILLLLIMSDVQHKTDNFTGMKRLRLVFF